MFKKLFNWLDKVGVNHSQFIAALVLLCLVVLVEAYRSGAAPGLGILVALAGSALNVALFVVVAFALQFFMGGLKIDIPKEVFREHNTASAIYMGALFIALAMLIKAG